MKSYAFGDMVLWTSQAAGSKKTKRGRVVEVVAPHRRPTAILHYGRRDHESYVVEVTRQSGATDRYWPLVKHLRRTRAAK